MRSTKVRSPVRFLILTVIPLISVTVATGTSEGVTEVTGEGNIIETTVREKTKEHLIEALGALYEHRGIIVPEGITLHEPMRCINIYGELTHYMYVYHYSVNSNPMSIDDIKTLGEKNIDKKRVEFAYPDGYGYIIVTADENPRGSFHQHGLPSHFYNYSSAVKSAVELLGTEDVEFKGIVYKFKYWGLLFEGNNDKVLINPAHYFLDEAEFEEGGKGWKFFMWEDIEPHIDEWDLGRLSSSPVYNVKKIIFRKITDST